MAKTTYVLMGDDYGVGNPITVSDDVGVLKREAERLEHGQRKKPRTYKWEPGDKYENPGTLVLNDTRGDSDGRFRIVPVPVLPQEGPSRYHVATEHEVEALVKLRRLARARPGVYR